MSNRMDVETAELTDGELVALLRNHGMNRRGLMRLFGAGAVVAGLGGTAAAKPGGVSIDEVYGASYEASESVPSGVVDQVVQLHLHFEPPGPPEFFFDPVGVHLEAGEVIDFEVHSGLHTVTALHPKFDEPGAFEFPDRVPTENGFTSAVMNTGDSWLYRFSTPGVYDIMCLPHYDFGMVVRVVVTGRNPNDPIPEDSYDDSLLPPAVEDVFDAPEMTPQHIVDNGTVGWDDLTL